MVRLNFILKPCTSGKLMNISLRNLNYNLTPNYSLCMFSHSHILLTYRKLVNIATYNEFSNRLSFLYKENHFLRTYSTHHKRCWNCGSEESYILNFCKNCKYIQPFNKEINYFERLGFKKSLKINKKDLVISFRKLQNIFHPDKFSLKSEQERIFAAEHSSMLNKGFNVINHPVSRAEYLLTLAGQSIEEGELTMDPEFLMEIMEINERLADATDEESIQAISAKNTELMDSLIREAEKLFEKNEITSCRTIVAKMKYYNNIYEKVKDYEIRYGIVH